MSLFTLAPVCSHVRSRMLTWCRAVYWMKHLNGAAIESTRKYSQNSNGGGQSVARVKADASFKMGGKKTTRNKMGVVKQMFRPRPVSEQMAPEEDQDDLRNLSESDRFGEGVGKFKETSDTEKHRKLSQKIKKTPSGWSETFGTLVTEEEETKNRSTFADNEKYWDELQEEEKATKFHNHIPLSRYNRRHIPNWYARRIEKLGKKGKIREAIEVFDKWMIEQDRVKPTSYEFQILIDLLAQVGYTTKAFQLYNQMCAMGLRYPDLVFTSLFNACANSPWPENGLGLAEKLRTKLLVKDVQPNYITYLAMIKAFGKCGDINTAFSLADEAARLKMTDDLLNNLLVACVSDKHSGFRHAVMVWRKMKKFGIQPTLASYNLLLRTVHECGIGDQKLISKLLENSETDKNTSNKAVKLLNDAKIKVDENSTESATISPNENLDKLKGSRQKVFKEIDTLLAKYELNEPHISEADKSKKSQEDALDLTSNSMSLKTQENKEWWELDIFQTSGSDLMLKGNEEACDNVTLPNVLDPKEDFSAVIRVGLVQTKEERLALLGGMDGFLKSLQEDKVTPDIVTYTQLAQVVPGYLEDKLIEEMWANGVKPDIDFYNLLIAKRVRKDRQGALDLYRRLQLEELVPNIQTFSCLAFLCYTKEEGMKLLAEMMVVEVMPNNYTFAALLWVSKYDFNYKKAILQKMQELGVKPSIRAIELLEARIQEAKTLLVKFEKQRPSDEIQKQKTETFARKLNSFLNFYETWAQYNCIEVEQHPWKDFMDEKKDITSVP